MAKTYAFVGDSQLGGLRPHLAGAFAPDTIGPVVQRNGAGIDWALSISGSQLRNLQRADVVVVLIGGNDGRWRTASGAASYQSKCKILERRLAAYGAMVVWCGPWVARDSATAARHDRARTAQHRAGLERWIDVYPHSRDLPLPDGVHSTSAGYELAASRLVPLIKKAASGSHLGWVAVAAIATVGLVAYQKA